MARAKSVPNRGYYFDFLTLLASLEKHQTPATPAISLLWALDVQLDRILAEGLANRFARHMRMRDRTIEWARDRDFTLRAEPGHESPTVSCIDNTYGWDIGALNRFLRTRNMILGNGYGTLKNITWRIGHMGELDVPDIDVLLLLHRQGFRIREVPVKMAPSPPMRKPMHAGLRAVYYPYKMLLSTFRSWLTPRTNLQPE